MTQKEIFWKLLSKEKKQELFDAINADIINDRIALAVIDLPFCIGNNEAEKVEFMLSQIKAPPHIEPMAWKIHEMLYDE